MLLMSSLNTLIVNTPTSTSWQIIKNIKIELNKFNVYYED